MKKGFTHESTHNKSVEWYTPKYIFDALGIEFDLDPCSPGANVVPWIPAKKHLTFEDNGLMAKWEGAVWMNPPYGRETPDWLGKLATHGNGMALVFCRPDTIWFHKHVRQADALCLMKGRVKFIHSKWAKTYVELGFDNTKGRPGAPSMLIAYGEDMSRALFDSDLGLTLRIIQSEQKRK